ncbi:MAG: hypothetical protein NVS9B14_22530 [Candidatus Acidiferrum sp.]
MPPVTETSSNEGNNAGPSAERSTQNAGAKKHYVAGALVLLAVGIAAFVYSKMHVAGSGFSLQDARAERITQHGKAAAVAISNDGQTIAYVLRGGVEQSIMLRRTGDSADIQLVAPVEVNYAGLAFSPDGQFLYFTASSKENHLYSSLYKISVQGGAATKLVDDIDTAVSFSPDGSKFAFIRGIPDKRANDLLVANADGSDVKTVVRKSGLVYAASLIAPAWSPDGKTIVFTNYAASNRRLLLAVSPDGTGLRELYKSHEDLGRAQWLPDGTSLLVPVREEKLGERGQFWRVEFPSGSAQRILNDTKDYSLMWNTLSRNGRALATVETTVTGDLSLLPNGETTNERQLTTDGALVVYVSKFGKDRILYETREGHVYTADSEGGNAKEIGIGGKGMLDVSACGDGKHIVYAELGEDTQDIWRADADGSNGVQLTHDKSAKMPNCSPDGQWAIYWNDEQRSFYRVPVAGGRATQVSLPNPSDPYVRISPDGNWVTYTAEGESSATKEYNVVIAPANGGAPVRTFPMVPGMGMAPPQWSIDGRSLYFNLMRQGASNIWKMDTPGGELKQITNFPSGLIASYTWSADGKTLYVARGTKSSDVVLLKSGK